MTEAQRTAPSAAIVRLNIGGTRFYTTSATLLSTPERNFFHGLLDEKFSAAALKDENGFFFIDRDGELFRPILRYLRSHEWVGSPDALAEARFYNIYPSPYTTLTDASVAEQYKQMVLAHQDGKFEPNAALWDQLMAWAGERLMEFLAEAAKQQSGLRDLYLGFVLPSKAAVLQLLKHLATDEELDAFVLRFKPLMSDELFTFIRLPPVGLVDYLTRHYKLTLSFESTYFFRRRDGSLAMRIQDGQGYYLTNMPQQVILVQWRGQW